MWFSVASRWGYDYNYKLSHIYVEPQIVILHTDLTTYNGIITASSFQGEKMNNTMNNAPIQWKIRLWTIFDQEHVENVFIKSKVDWMEVDWRKYNVFELWYL